MHKTSRYIKYFISRCFKGKQSWQVAQFDTINMSSTFMSDILFSPVELKHW